ncbi:MAG: methylamine utilization protein [Hyphomonadaceae bacterium]|nr:methylamine utilization protein [Hyphomonadaceae bacterium]
MLGRFLTYAATSFLFATQAWAGDIVIRVTTPDGKPLPDAVVLMPAKPGGPKPAPIDGLKMAQAGKQFTPFVLIAPVGSTVEFPNLDKFRHHVYSFSKGNKFELELYGREEKRVITFKTTGVAALGCNIHDQMVAFIRVVDTPWAAKSGDDGVARLTAAPDGSQRIDVWHPYATAKDQTVTQTITVSPGATTVTVVLGIAPPS